MAEIITSTPEWLWYDGAVFEFCSLRRAKMIPSTVPTRTRITNRTASKRRIVSLVVFLRLAKDCLMLVTGLLEWWALEKSLPARVVLLWPEVSVVVWW